MSEKKLKLLVVDDEAEQCESLKNCFLRRNFIVFTAMTGREALASIKKNKPDLVVLDLKLPDVSGRDVLREVRKDGQKIKIIIVTGSILSEQEIQELANLGIDELLFKPIDINNLENVIKKALKRNSSKTFRFEAIKPKGEESTSASLRSITHDFSNVTSDIAAKCELYILDTEEGLNKNKIEKERLDEAIRVIESVSELTKRLTKLIKDLSSLTKK